MDRAIPTNKSTSKKNNNSPRSIRQITIFGYCKKRDIKRWFYHVCTNSFYCCKNKIKVTTKAKYFVIMGEALRLTRVIILSMYIIKVVVSAHVMGVTLSILN